VSWFSKTEVLQNHGFKSQHQAKPLLGGPECCFKNSKMAALLAILWFLKPQSLLHPNTLIFKTKVFFAKGTYYVHIGFPCI
jgi:hypothetical protein